MATPLQTGGKAVVGYFATGDAAHRAINALIDGGFMAAEIGAAFHVGSNANQTSGSERTPTERTPNVGGNLREELGTTLSTSTTHANSLSSAASDSSAVQFGNLGPGSGTVYDGPSRPGPISGSDLSNTGLPSELKSSLPHDADLAREGGGHASSSWSSRLDPVFGVGERETGRGNREAPVSAPVSKESQKESQKFGTGEGSLNLTAGRPYSRQGFESSFSGYGVHPEHARYLSNRIGHGGAVVTVHTEGRAEEAERILEAHGGQVRYSAETAEENAGSNGEVEVFGTIGRDYPSRTR